MTKPKPRGVKCPKCSSIVVLPQVDASRVKLQCESCGHAFAIRVRQGNQPGAAAAQATPSTGKAAGTPPIPQASSASPTAPLGTAPLPAASQPTTAPSLGASAPGVPAPGGPAPGIATPSVPAPAANPLGQAPMGQPPLGSVPVSASPQPASPGLDAAPIASSARKVEQIDDFDDEPQGFGINAEAAPVIQAKQRNRGASRKKQAQNRWLAVALTGGGIIVALVAVGLAVMLSGWMAPTPDTTVSPLELAEEIKAADEALLESFTSLESEEDAKAFVDSLSEAESKAQLYLARAILARKLNEKESDTLMPLPRATAPSPVKLLEVGTLLAELPAEKREVDKPLQRTLVAHRIATDYLSKANVDLASPDGEAETIDHDLITEWRNINRLIAKQILKSQERASQNTDNKEDRLTALSRIYSPIQAEVRISINQLEKRAEERSQLTADQIFVSHQYNQALTAVQTGFIILTNEHKLEMNELGLDLGKDFQRALTAITNARQANAEALANEQKSDPATAEAFASLNEAIENPDDEKANAVVEEVKNDPRFDFEKDAGTKRDPVMGEIPK